jgi:uncharacterized protein involved in outer membrane biogenesis
LPKKSAQRVFIALLAILFLIAISAFLGRSLLGANVKGRLEADASAALGMQVEIGGDVSLRFFPELHVTLRNVHITNRGAQIAVIDEVDLGIELRSLLRKDLKFQDVGFRTAKITIERDKSGHLNSDHPSQAASSSGTLSFPSVSSAQSAFSFDDAQSGKAFKIDNCNFAVKDLQLAPAGSVAIMQTLSFTGNLTCREFRSQRVAASQLKLAVHGSSGLFNLDPVTFKMFGGEGHAVVTADFTAAESVYRVHSSISKLQIADFSKSELPQKLGDGTVDFSADITMRGTFKNGVMRSAQGAASLHGENLVLDIGDLDKEFSRYESTQNFNLIDVGAFFLAGPIGLAVTKGYDYARVLKKTPGRTTIRTLVSRWKVEHGVAEADDVALATTQNRVAMHGGLNFVNDTYDDVTVALVGPKGCVRVEQKIHGPFSNPDVEKPNVVTALTGPARKLVNKGRNLLGAKCSVFYVGVVAAPQ